MKFISIMLFAALTWNYACAENWFKENTKWYVASFGFGAGPGNETYSEKLFELLSPEISDEEDDVLALYVTPLKDDEPDGERTLTCYIRTEGDKVYFKMPKFPDEWHLLYDFSLSVDESVEVGHVRYGYNAYLDHVEKYDMYCFEVDVDKISGEKIMKVIEKDSIYFNIIQPEDYCYFSGNWIAGLGSDEGPIENCWYNADGDGGSRLYRVVNGDHILYEIDNPNIINKISEDTQLQPKYGLDGRLLSPDAKGLYIQNGRLRLNPSR